MVDSGSNDGRRILLVDDEEALVWSLYSRLKRVRPNYIVETAHEGATALKKLRQQRIELLVADVRMPGMSGIDLVLSARSEDPDLPVIVITAFRTPDVQRLADAPFIAYLEKPFDFDKFLHTVDDALAHRPKVGFSGAISVQTLPDIVQLYVLSNTTGTLTIRHRTGDGRIWFENGQIPHAATGTMVGEEAFHKVMAWSGGDFGMKLGERPPVRSITANWQELIMESCRRIDERRRSDDMRLSSTGWEVAKPVDEAEFGDIFGDEETVPRSDIPPAVIEPPAPERSTPIIRLEDTMNVKEGLQKLNQVDGFIGAALVDAESGMLLGQEGGGSMNLEVAAAGNTEVVKSKRKVMQSLNLKDTIEDILITLGKQYHLIRPLRARPTLFFYVAIDRSRANLAMARIALADVEKDLQV